MDRNLRLNVLHLAVGYWGVLWLFSYGWGMPIPLIPLVYPSYRCGQLFRAGRIWYLGALVSIVLTCIPLSTVQVWGLLSFFPFFAVANLHLAVKMNNLQASIILALSVFAYPLAFLVPWLGGIWTIAEGLGLVLLLLSAPDGGACREEKAGMRGFIF